MRIGLEMSSHRTLFIQWNIPQFYLTVLKSVFLLSTTAVIFNFIFFGIVWVEVLSYSHKEK
jgi:hypothetical protein